MRQSARAFSLVELMVVLSIIAVLTYFASMALNPVLRSSRLSQGHQDLVNELDSARQIALAKNRAVEFRFYRFADSGQPGETKDQPDTGHYRGFQTFLCDDEGVSRPLGKLRTLPPGVIFSAHEILSPLLASSLARNWTTADPQPDIPAIRAYDTRAFRFFPNGSTNLNAASSWFVSLHSLTDGDNLTALPGNYATVRIDPVNGQTQSYRP